MAAFYWTPSIEYSIFSGANAVPVAGCGNSGANGALI
jgi:hypothetical protein